MSLRIESHRTFPESGSLLSDWHDLAQRIDPPMPFHLPVWHQLWWKHFEQSQTTVRDELRIYTLHDTDHRLVAVAPMMVTHRPGKGFLRVSQLQFLGADANMTEVRGLICTPDDEARAVKALAEHLHTTDAPLWHWIQWYGLRNPSSGPALGQGNSSVQITEDIPDYLLELPSSWDEFRAGLPRNVKESLRKCYNSLKRDGHEFEFRVISSPEACPEAIARFVNLHANRAAANVAVRHNNVFATPHSQAFLSEYAGEMAARNQLRVFQIAIAGVVVATRIGFVFGQSLYLYYSGYQIDWGRYSIMTTVLAEAIKWAIANGLASVNLSTGRDVSKTRWDPSETVFRSAVVIPARWQGRLAHHLYQRLKSGSRSGAIALLKRR